MTKKLTKRDRPIPKDIEIKISVDDELISITDPKGIITKVNDTFCRVAGYSEEELVGSSHNLIRHPDMPKVMFKIVWDRIMDSENVMAVIKNLAKDGSYYWVVTDFVTKIDAEGTIIDYTAYRRPVNDKVKNAIEPLYKALLAIEELAGMNASEKFITDYFESIGMSYDEMVEEIIVKNCDLAKVIGGDNMTSDIKTMSKNKKLSFFNKLFGVK